MRRFKLQIKLSTEDMATESDVASALEDIAGSLRDFVYNDRRICGVQTVYDSNGNTVGNWEIHP